MNTFIHTFTLPPFIYQTIDHIYISDERGFIYASHFTDVIHLNGIQSKGTWNISHRDSTFFLSVKDNNTPDASLLDSLIHWIENDPVPHPTEHPKTTEHPRPNVRTRPQGRTYIRKYLLYSENVSDIIWFLNEYLISRYKYTSTDIQHLLSLRKLPYVYLKELSVIK